MREFSDDELIATAEQYRPTMEKLLWETQRDRKERGFRVCYDVEEGKPYTQEICVGEECGVPMKPCPHGLMTFHTHPPGGGWVPSPGDVVNGFGAGDLLECVGAVRSRRAKTGGVACYRLNKNFDEIEEFLRTWMAGQYSPEFRYSDIITDMMAEAMFKPTEHTLFRKVKSWELG